MTTPVNGFALLFQLAFYIHGSRRGSLVNAVFELQSYLKETIYMDINVKIIKSHLEILMDFNRANCY